jgi:hypothetical protein
MPRRCRRAGDAHRGGVGSPLLFPVMPAHSRPKDGVLSHAYVAGIHVFTTWQKLKSWMAGTSGVKTALRAFRPAMTMDGQCLNPAGHDEGHP